MDKGFVQTSLTNKHTTKHTTKPRIDYFKTTVVINRFCIIDQAVLSEFDHHADTEEQKGCVYTFRNSHVKKLYQLLVIYT